MIHQPPCSISNRVSLCGGVPAARTCSLLCLLIALLGFESRSAHGIDLYWRTDGTAGGTWTSTFWNLDSANATGGTGYTSAATTNVFFTADSTLTNVTGQLFGNLTVDAGRTVTVTQTGTVSAAAHIIDIGAGATLNWASQNYTAAGTSFVKNGDGIWNLGAIGNAYTGGFTLNAGTVIVGGNNSFGNSTLNINGGTIQSSGTRAFAPTSIVIGGDFAIIGTGGWTINGTVDLGAATRTITNNATGTKTWNGIVSGGVGTGLTLSGTGVNAFTNASNSFPGPITITGGEHEFTSLGALGAGTNITVDGGRLALRNTFDVSSKNIVIGDDAGTSISTPGAGVITYNGVLANKSGESGSWAKQGGGTLELGGVSTYTGSTSLNNGFTVLTTGNNRLPTGTTLNIGQASSSNLGTLNLNGFNQEIAGINSTLGSNATANNNTITSIAPAILTLSGSGSYSYGDGSDTNSGIIAGAISLVKSGGGTQVLSDLNTFTGDVTVTGGTLSIGNVDIIGNAQALGQASSAVALSGGSTIRYTGPTGTLARDVTIGAGNGTISNTGAGILTLSGTLTKDGTILTLGGSVGSTINITGSIVGASAGSDLIVDTTTVLVSANQNYNGPTTVQNSGTLVANASVTTTQLTVDAGSTVSGIGSIENGAGLVYLNGALVVGDSTLVSPVVSQFEIGGVGTTVLGATSSLVFDLFTGNGLGDSTAIASAADRLKLFGTLDATLGGTLVIGNPSSMTGFADGDMWTLFDYTGGGSISGTFASIDYSALNLSGGLVGTFDSGTGVFSVSNIPEPSRAMLLALGIVGLIQRRRR